MAPSNPTGQPYFYGALYQQQREELAAHRARRSRSTHPEDSEMVYDWDGKENTCFQMYIEENKSLEEIMAYFKDKHNFAPSKRAFQTQIKKWNFPSKHHPATKNEALVQRAEELWRKNTSQKDMLMILNSEGHGIKDRELTRLRHANQWRLRIANAKPPAKNAIDPTLQAPDLEHPGDTYSADSPAGDRTVFATNENTARKRRASPELPPEVQAKLDAAREARLAESAIRLAQRTRRRRTKEWAGIPPDPPGPPRFQSETTIEESKRFLNLDDDTYSRLRDEFQKICESHGVVKKTLAGPETWQALKNELVQNNAHLQTVFYAAEGTNLTKQTTGLDVICSDVTKRIRTLKTRVTIAQAKNDIGVDPQQARDLRAAFYKILVADHFTSKLEAGEEHWKELKEKWISESPLLQQVLGPGDADPDHAAKVKATEVLCRDVMKRLRDDQTKKDPHRRKRAKIQNLDPSIQNGAGSSNGIENGISSSIDTDSGIGGIMNNDHVLNNGINNGIATLASQALASAQYDQDYTGQIDPSLLFAANTPTVPTPYPTPHPGAQPTPIYLRLSPTSQIQSLPTLWLETLPFPPTIRGLHEVAASKHGGLVDKIEGVVKVEGGEVKWRIEEEDELMGYLGHVGVGQGGKATFLISLVES